MKKSYNRAAKNAYRSQSVSRVMTAVVLTLGLFANLFSFTHNVEAANSAVRLDAFQLSDAMTLSANGAQSGPGSFIVNNGSLTGYIEGACIPLVITVTNSSDDIEDVPVSLVYDFAADGTQIDDIRNAGFIGSPDNASNLNNFGTSENLSTSLSTFTGTILARFRNDGSTIVTELTGPFSGTGTDAVTSTDDERNYQFIFKDVPAATGTGNTKKDAVVDLYVCAELGVDSASNGANMSVRLDGQGIGAQNIGISANGLKAIPSLTIEKTVINDTNGAVTTPSSFDFSVSPAINGQTTFTVPMTSATAGSLTIENVIPDTYSVTENPITNFTTTFTPSAECSALTSDVGGNALLPKPADTTPANVTCAFTNTAVDPNPNPNPTPTGEATLNIVLDVVNDNGGTLDATAFTVHIAGATASNNDFAGEAAPGTAIQIAANESYSVFVNDTQGYSQNGTVPECETTTGIAEDEEVTCIITLDDPDPNPPLNGALVTVVKHVVNNDGTISPALDASDFTFEFSVVTPNGLFTFPDTINGSETGAPLAFLDPSQLALFGNSFQYQITEVDSKGYNASFSPECSGTITFGSNIICTVTNDDPAAPSVPLPAELVTIVDVVNDNGGTAIAADFTVHIDGTGMSNNDFPGSATPGASILVSPSTAFETTLVNDPADQGYAASFSTGCEDTGISEGQTITCTITLDDIAPKLFIRKDVVNDNPGDTLFELTRANFQLFLDGTPTTNDGVTAIEVNAGTHTIIETPHFAYKGTFSGDCDANGNVTIDIGETKTCVLTNDDLDPEAEDTAILTIRKIVENDNGGTQGTQNFQLFLDGTPLNSTGDHVLFVTPGTHVVSETTHSGYVGTFTVDCDANGNVTLAGSENKLCVLTNRDPGTPPSREITTINVITNVINDNGGAAVAADFTIGLDFTNGDGSEFFPGSETGTLFAVDPGPYDVFASDDTNYSVSLSEACVGTIIFGENRECIVTFNDKPQGGTSIPPASNQGGDDNGGNNDTGSTGGSSGGSGGGSSSGSTDNTSAPTPSPEPAGGSTTTEPVPVVLGAEDTAEDEAPATELPRTGLPFALLLALPVLLLGSVRTKK